MPFAPSKARDETGAQLGVGQPLEEHVPGDPEAEAQSEAHTALAHTVAALAERELSFE